MKENNGRQRAHFWRCVSTLRYTARVYIGGGRGVMPAVALLLALSLLYSMAPARVADSYAFSMTILFCVMVWLGLGFDEAEDPVAQQLVILRLGSAVRFFSYGALFLLATSGVFGLFAALYPVGLHALRGGGLFHTSPTPGAVGIAWVLLTAAAFMGGALGALLHPRIVPDRRIARLLALFGAVLCCVRTGVHSMFPASRAVTWLIPPVSRASELLAGLDAFPADVALGLLAQFLLYGVVLSAIRVLVAARRGFA